MEYEDPVSKIVACLGREGLAMIFPALDLHSVIMSLVTGSFASFCPQRFKMIDFE